MKTKNMILLGIGAFTVAFCMIIIVVNKDKLAKPVNADNETTDQKIIVEIAKSYNLNTFDMYLEKDDIIIYKRPEIKEIYFNNENDKTTLQEYLTNTFQTTDDGIKQITELLELKTILNDGGTQIYKSEDYNITVIKCNTLKGNRDIFIGTYDMDYIDDEMCNREN